MVDLGAFFKKTSFILFLLVSGLQSVSVVGAILEDAIMYSEVAVPAGTRQDFSLQTLLQDSIPKVPGILESTQDVKNAEVDNTKYEVGVETTGGAKAMDPTIFNVRPTDFGEDVVTLPEIQAVTAGVGRAAFASLINEKFVIPEVDKGIAYLNIVVRFIVEKDGTLSSFSVLKDPGFGAGEEAVRVLKELPRWKPACKNNEAVRSIYLLPITIAIP